METKKQTAVDWLIESLEKHEHDFEKGIISFVDYVANIKWVKGNAKAMHKQQIIEANEDCSTNELGELLTGGQYYKETYEK
jgi:hypothetical protein